ncbi:MAG: VWA domain-containing protein [Chitinophagales bacterium]|nr:VWA domain-containing protein [Chitinophagales bacterium]
MLGFRFEKFRPDVQTPFDRLFNIFKQLLTYTSGDVAEALHWLTELDKEYQLSTDEYGIGDFIEDLKERGYIREAPNSKQLNITPAMEQSIRQSALEHIFGKLRKSRGGHHRTVFSGEGDESTGLTRPYSFGDSSEHIAVLETFRNAQIHSGCDDFCLKEDDIVVADREHRTQSSTVLMIDISHSMILYGEDRITPAKNVAMALAELIQRKYPNDTLDILVFGDDAWQIELKDVLYLTAGPYHTNTAAGLELAMDLLRRRKNPNKQIFMITDGKPSCMKINGQYYKNSFGLDRKIVNHCLSLASRARKLRIPVTTFMVASDPYLQQFVEAFTLANQGKAYYTSLKGLGEYLFEDFERGKRRNLR